jgi:hypothetical protein
MRRALVRAATSHALVALAVLLVGAGLAAGALVGFSADTQTQTSTLAGGWLNAPTSLQAPVVRGNGATLTWTPATHDVAAQSIYGTDRGTTTNCTGATYATAFDTGVAANATTVNDDRGGSASGHWICYQARSEHGSWNKTANFSIVQVGLVPTGIAITNGSNSGQSSPNDTIDLKFNQNITYSGSSPITVCVFKTTANTILIGDTGCGSASDTPTIGKITGLSIPNANRTYELSTAAVFNNNTLRITLNTSANGANNRTAVTGTGTFTWTGSGSIVQSSQGAASVCTAANCTWTWSGSF